MTLCIFLVVSCSDRCDRCVPPPEVCVQYHPKRDAAIEAKDWARLEKEARYYTSTCDGWFDNGVANGYADLSMALRHLNRLDEAYVEAGRGIITTYKEPNPHLEKAKVLIAQKKYTEAEQELTVAESLAKQAIKERDRIDKIPSYPPIELNSPADKWRKSQRLRHQNSLKAVEECKATLPSKRKANLPYQHR